MQRSRKYSMNWWKTFFNMDGKSLSKMSSELPIKCIKLPYFLSHMKKLGKDIRKRHEIKFLHARSLNQYYIENCFCVRWGPGGRKITKSIVLQSFLHEVRVASSSLVARNYNEDGDCLLLIPQQHRCSVHIHHSGVSLWKHDEKTKKYELSTFNFLLLNSVKELSFLLKENKYLTYYYNFMYYYK